MNIAKRGIPLFLALLMICTVAYADTVVTEGTAFTGGDITPEDARMISLNDARRKAVELLGVLRDPDPKSGGGLLTRDQVRTIACSVMGTEISGSSREFVQGGAMLKVEAGFSISRSGLDEALNRFKDRPKDRKTITELIKSIHDLQQELGRQGNRSPEAPRIIHGIYFDERQLGRLLATKELASHEKRLGELYQKRVRDLFFEVIFPAFNRQLPTILSWGKVSSTEPHKYRVEFDGLGSLPGEITAACQRFRAGLQDILAYYFALNFKTIERRKFYARCVLPVHVQVNAQELVISVTLGFTYDSIVVRPSWNPSAKAFYIYMDPSLKSGYRPERFQGWDVVLQAGKGVTPSELGNIRVRAGQIKSSDVHFNLFEPVK